MLSFELMAWLHNKKFCVMANCKIALLINYKGKSMMAGSSSTSLYSLFALYIHMGSFKILPYNSEGISSTLVCRLNQWNNEIGTSLKSTIWKLLQSYFIFFIWSFI